MSRDRSKKRKAHIPWLSLAVLLLANGCSKTGEPAPAGGPGEPPRPAAQEETVPAEAAPGEESAAVPGAPVRGHQPAETGDDAALPPGHPPISGMGEIVPPPPGSGQGETAVTWNAPAAWKEEPTRTLMRRAQYRVPGADGDPEDGECVVFYFGPGQGGSPESNALRWVDQFQQPDGSSSQGRSKIELRSVGGHQVMFVEVRGTYIGMAMPGMPPAESKPKYALLGAIVPGPDAHWFFKFTGPEKTVEKNRAAFESMISSVRHGA